MNDSILFTVAIALIGILAAHRLALRRERNVRKQKFRAFLVEWHSAVSKWPEYWAEKDQSFEAVYRPKLAAFCAAKENVRNDFKDKVEFDRLANRLGSLTNTEWRYSQSNLNKAQKDVILKAMDDLLNFIK